MGASGIELKCAVKRATTWGTAVACGASNGILVKPHTLVKKRNLIVDDSLGKVFHYDAMNAEIAVSGALPCYLRYDSLDLLIALAMGAVAGTPTQQGATTAYAQSFKLADNIDTFFATFIQNNTINIDEYTSVKITGFTIKGSAGKPVEISFEVLANDRITGSSTNTIATFANVTDMEVANRVLYSQGAFRLNSQSGAALDSTSLIYPTDFELAFKRKMKGTYGVGSFSNIDEPTNDGLPTVTLKLTFPRYTSANQGYFSDWDAMNAKKMDITFTGANIASTYNRTFKITLPNLVISNVDMPVKDGILESPIEFNALACSTAPTGMSGITAPFQVDVINQQSANVLTS